ncbi:hypothetical protein [Mycolicibacterium moriokaense]|uniref:Uncharacterized protein n=1 Tax=Mycolicibacterium moriokaense TaxID=39691 RepID=A0AAD1M5B5_9MYCO|nr:hypothetical protein [Mycolicibacterium moriokaense]BBX00120.1 hypothetical protein MMOR_10560 [Mycolicibacterium moriokaense]
MAVLLSTAALVVALIGLVREPDQMSRAEQSPPATTTAATDSGDQALCEEIAPLIKESSANKNEFVGLGEPDSPERNAGIPTFVEITRDWASRAQKVLDTHAEPPRYLTRTLQRYIDDMRLFVDGLRPGPEDDADRALWTDSIGALGGPLTACLDQGIELWQR